MTGILHDDRYTFLIEMFRAKRVEKIKTNFLCSKTFFFENRAVYYNAENQYRADQATDDVALALCMLGT